VLPPDRRDLAVRAWPAIERANPGLPGPVCELAAELAEAAGEPVAAAQRLVDSARRALAGGALTSAEAAAHRARQLAVSDPITAAAADEVMVHVFVAAGKAGEALALGRRVVASPRQYADDARRADLLVAVARAAITAGEAQAAEQMIDDARAVTRDDASPGAAGEAGVARIDALAAHVALELNRLDDAAALARSAVDAGGRTDQPEVQCEALEVLGRLARAGQPAESDFWFEQEAEVARSRGLARWHLRAQQELALSAWSRADLQPLRDTRDLAARYGAMITVAVMDLSLADVALAAFDRDACLTAARSCVDASRRYGLATESVAGLWLAGAHALAGDDEQMKTAIDHALRRDPDDPRILADLYGRVLTTRAVVADDLESLATLLDTSMEYVREAPPAASIYPGRLLWATVHAVDDDDFGAAARAQCTEAIERIDMPILRYGRDVYEAAALARQGDTECIRTVMSDALAAFRDTGLGAGMGYTQILLVARAAVREGWGEPVAWLRETEAFFAAGGYERPARRCRSLLAEVGAAVPRRGRGDSVVPATLRALGVTSREVDVLKLAAAGLSTKAIAQALVLSPKTVEHHLASLSDRTGARGRGALTEFARGHGVNADVRA
jgi:DNA-binding CsgD family transcriptional regulator